VTDILRPLIDLCEAILVFFHDQLGFSWGAAIIGLTVVVRLAILPLTFRQVRSMQGLQRLQPEMKKIQEKYKDDRQRMNQEVMRFYQEHKVNPLGSCLPILLQIPFFISIFYLLREDAFRQDIQGEESFLIIQNLAEPAAGATLIILIVLYVASQLAATLVTLISADKTQRRIFLALPFLFVAFVWSFEAGLLVYWITTNFWTLGQQLFVKRFLPPPEPLSASPVDAALGKTKVGSIDSPKDGDKGKPRSPRPAARVATEGAAGAGSGANGGKAPPPSPRRKKKRSGRRR